MSLSRNRNDVSSWIFLVFGFADQVIRRDPSTGCLNRLSTFVPEMPVSSIAQILLRLFALNWLLAGGIQIATVVILLEGPIADYFYPMLPNFLYLAAGVLLWFFAPALSRLLASRNDDKFNLEGVTERQLFSVSFLSLGLYFALSSVATVFSWAHFYMINKSPEYGFHHEEAPSYYELLEGVVTLLSGLALVFTAQTWARKLTRRGPGQEPGAPGV
jgi:type IV secretory pathway TrbD component